ncbi:MAG: cyanophycin synthetase, partial [Candidatus Eisenbacteria bacterium]|nr:cyanophycin synthetase [Candidatus Eisenbacteria bacterium]
GRMNVYHDHPFKVIVDYGHNPAAIQAVCDTIDRLEVKGRRLVVLAAPGDRRDEDIREIGRVAAKHFDYYVCRRDDGLRGRGSDEIPRMLRSALLEAGVSLDQINLISEEERAVDHALRTAKPGDLLLLFADDLQRTWKQVEEFDSRSARPAEERALQNRATVDLPRAAMSLEDAPALIRDERGVRLASREPEVAD